VLGFDGGGTKIEAALMDETGAVVGWGSGGPAVSWYEETQCVRASVAQAVEAAIAGSHVEVSAVVAAGPAGIQDALGTLGDLIQAAPRRMASEFELIMAAHGMDRGLTVLAGTGSGVFVRAPSGGDIHMGGSGPVIGDEGSAYDIGLRAIRACLRAGYSPPRPTTLVHSVPRAAGLEQPGDLVRWVYVHKASRRDIARLARTVDREAEGGDTVALAILRAAARALGDLAVEALGVADLRATECPMAVAGSVVTRSCIYRRYLLERVREDAPAVRPVDPGPPPAVGAALLALRDLGIAWGDKLLARARETTEQWQET